MSRNATWLAEVLLLLWRGGTIVPSGSAGQLWGDFGEWDRLKRGETDCNKCDDGERQYERSSSYTPEVAHFSALFDSQDMVMHIIIFARLDFFLIDVETVFCNYEQFLLV